MFILDSALDHDIIFISADHRLLLPGTGFDIIEDMKSLFAFLAAPDFSLKHLPPGITLDPARIAISGESGGGYAARAAGIYASPKPRAVLLQFAMGGQLLDNHWLSIKDDLSTPPGPCVTRELIAHLLDKPQQPISYDPMVVLGDEPLDPDQPQSMRTAVLRYWLVNGELPDYVLGTALSHTLRSLPYERRIDAIPEALRPAILQSQIDETFPPTVLFHGQEDDLILSDESRLTYERLVELGVRAKLYLVEGAWHCLIKPPEVDGQMVWDLNNPPRLVEGAAEVQMKAFDFVLRELRI